MSCRRSFFVVCVAIVASSAGAQNLVTNGGFDLDPTNPTNGWTATGTGVLSHNLGMGDPAPPSARVDATGPQWLTLQQCVSIVAGTKYEFSARSYTHLSYGSSTNSVSLSFFSGAGCTSGLISTVVSENLSFPNWAYHSTTDVVAPPGAVAARIELAADGADAVMDISWDDAVVQPDINIFEHGFESGDISGWSAMSCGNDPAPAGGSCPPECTGGCIGDVCVIDCGTSSSCQWSDIICPPNFVCEIRCTGDSGCESASIHCPSNYACTVACENANSCSYAAIHCPVSAPCELLCAGPATSCNSTEQTCGLANCEATCTGGQSPFTDCGNACSCLECS